MLLIQEIYYTLASENDKNVFEATLKVHCTLKRHLLQQTLQASGETEDQFVCRLHLHTVACKFGTNEDDQICDQFSDKCFSSGLHQEFLQKQGRNSFLT